jgi:hypothetical protein
MARETQPLQATVGLCSACRHAVRQEGARGSVFWRCLRAEEDARYRRYPPLPVRVCPGHEPPPPC